MSTRPRISFDEKGQCNVCKWSKIKKKINWNKRKIELKKILNTAKKKKLVQKKTSLKQGLLILKNIEQLQKSKKLFL